MVALASFMGHLTEKSVALILLAEAVHKQILLHELDPVRVDPVVVTPIA